MSFALLGALSATVGIVLLRLGIRLTMADSSEYRRNRERTGTLRRALAGKLPTFTDGIRDYRVHAGLAFDKTTNMFVPQGALSDEAVDHILRPTTGD